MTTTSSETLFRQAAQAEDGISISAGARVAHVRLAIESGRAIVVDLTGVPEAARTALIAEIKDLVQKAVVPSPARQPASETTNGPR